MSVKAPCPGRPVSPQPKLNLWLTINLKEPKHSSVAGGAWRRWRRKKKNTDRPCRPAFICLHTLPPKNSLISNGLILCFQYGLCKSSLMTFSILFYRAEARLKKKKSFSLKKKKRIRLEIENGRDPSCSYLMVSAADNRVWDLVGGMMMTENENVQKLQASHSSKGNYELVKDTERRDELSL